MVTRVFRRILAVVAAVVTAACAPQVVGDLCWPLDEPQALAMKKRPVTKKSEPDAKPTMTVYWDGSESLAGFIDASTEALRPLGDMQPILAGHAKKLAMPVHWKRFGRDISDLPSSNAAELGTANFYRCTGCDNNESHVDDVLRRIAETPGAGLSVVVTDLWLFDPTSTVSPAIALGGPVKAILADGRSIGIIGVEAPYRGAVTDIPGAATYRGARSRPLFVLLVGDRLDVLRTYDSMTKAGSPALRGMKFSLFSREPGSPWMGTSPALNGQGFKPVNTISGSHGSDVMQYVVKAEDLRSGKAWLRIPVKPGARILPGAVWRGQLSGSARVWRRTRQKSCSSAWSEEPQLQGAWKPDAKHGSIFTLDAATTAALRPGQDYLIIASLSSVNLAEKPPETDWIRQWSFDETDGPRIVAGRPVLFPTPNIGAFATQLEGGLRLATPATGLPLATTAVVLRIEP